MASLFQNDDVAEQDARRAQVESNRVAYAWDHVYLDPIPMLSVKHIHKGYGIQDLLEESAEFFEVLPPAERPHADYLVGRAEATAGGIARLTLDSIAATFLKINEVSDYERFIRGEGIPAHIAGNPGVKDTWKDDFTFAWQRIAGANPLLIERLNEANLGALQGKFQVTDAVFQRGTGVPNLSLAAEVASGRVFVVDYAVMNEPTPLATHAPDSDGRRVFPFCIGLFWWNVSRGELQPVAIQLTQTPSTIFTPEDGDAWLLAKMYFQVSDFNFHEMGPHLSNTHFIEEAFGVATARTLPDVHPVSCLLRAHFDMMLFNNWAGRELLVEPNGFVDVIQAGDLERGSIAMVKRWYSQWSFEDWNPEHNLKKRGLLNAADAADPVLPVYPWRDDALKVWAALGRFVRAYLANYYNSDADVAADPEIQAWAAEMTSPDGAHVSGFPKSFSGIEALAHALQVVCFQAGPGHASVNYPQFLFMGWIPNFPAAAWSSPPLNPANTGPEDILALLPPKAPASKQADIIFILTCYLYGRLGEYGKFITDAVAQTSVQHFQSELRDLTAAIAQANADPHTCRSRFPYLYLSPDRLPNSTNM